VENENISTMKKLFLIFLCLPAFANSQMTFNMGAGTDFKNALAHISIGYQDNAMVVEAIEQPTITRKSNSNNYFGIKAGYNFHNIIPGIGYYYNYKSADKKEQNHFAPGISLKYLLIINVNGGLYIEGTYIEKAFQLTAGFNVQPFFLTNKTNIK